MKENYIDNHKPIRLNDILVRMVKFWGAGALLKKLWRLRVLRYGIFKSARRRKKILKKEGLQVPMGIGLSPTMKCNLTCQGCYARFYPEENELTFEEIDAFISSAKEFGVFFIVITGGEPFMRPEMLHIYKKHRDLLFLVVTNGTFINEEIAREIAKSGNILPMVSLEGTREQTDERRGEGIYQKVMECMKLLKKQGIVFGFSAVFARKTIDYLGSEAFVEDMIKAGCTAGFYNELIPMDHSDLALIPGEKQQKTFKINLERLRNEKPIVLVHLPDDEYGKDGKCMPVSTGSIHVNTQGYAEPCPFAHFARENIRNHSFREILQSPFLEAVRRHPTLLKRDANCYGCSLAGNRELLEEVAQQTGAKSTEISSSSVYK